MSEQKKFACFDIDGTIFRSSLLIELVHVFIEQGVFPEKAREVYEDEHNTWLDRKGNYDAYIEAVVRAFRGHLQGVDVQAFDRAGTEVIERHRNHVYRYTRDLTKALKEHNYFLVAISHSPKLILDKFCDVYGFDKVYGKRYEIDEHGVFTGGVLENDTITDKSTIVARVTEKHNLMSTGSVAVGDSESDIPMLSAVERPICFNPNSKLYAHAQEHDWTVVVERKDVVYELCGNAHPYKEKNST